MGIELRSTDDPNEFEIFDEHGNVGIIWYRDPASVEIDEDDDFHVELVAGWVASMNHAFWESEPQPTAADAVREAWTMYGWLLEERRVRDRCRNGWLRVVRVPMGGQSRRW